MINFGELINDTKGKVNLLYYGVLNSKIDFGPIVDRLDVGVTKMSLYPRIAAANHATTVARTSLMTRLAVLLKLQDP